MNYSQYYADGEDAYAMKKDLSPLLEQVEQTREQLKSLGKPSLKNAIEQPINGKLHDNTEMEQLIEKLNLSNADPNIFDNACTGK